MSRIGFKPIPVPDGVDVTIKPGSVHVKGPKGELNQTVRRTVRADDLGLPGDAQLVQFVGGQPHRRPV